MTALRMPLPLILLTATALLLPAQVSQATVIAGWDFNGLTDGGPNNLSTTTEDQNVAVGGLTRNWIGAADPQARAGANTFGSNGLTALNQADAITSGAYLSFSITPSVAGVSLSEIAAYNLWLYEQDPSAPSQPTNFFGGWQYRINTNIFADIGSSFQLGSVSGNPGNLQAAVDLSGISDLQSMPSGTQADFRFVIWGAGYGANYAGFNSFQAGDDLIVNGTVPVPEPEMLGVVAIVLTGFGVASRRRRRA